MDIIILYLVSLIVLFESVVVLLTLFVIEILVLSLGPLIKTIRIYLYVQFCLNHIQINFVCLVGAKSDIRITTLLI